MIQSRWRAALVGLVATTSLAAGCATIGRVLGVEAPRFEMAEGRESVLSLDASSLVTGRPRARLRVWARVSNPNAFGFTLSTLRGTVFLEDAEMAEVDLPLGLPLEAARDTVIPLEISFGLPDLERLGALGEAILRRSEVGYRLDGIVGVDAGELGEPTFGPRTWLQGRLDVRTGLQRP